MRALAIGTEANVPSPDTPAHADDQRAEPAVKIGRTCSDCALVLTQVEADVGICHRCVYGVAP